MKILVFQHLDDDHPGVFRRFFEEDGHSWTQVALQNGEPIPSLDGFDALFVLGGVMDVWQEEAHPWLASEKEAIREAVEGRGMPYFGVCLGLQLLAEVLGGHVGEAERQQIGVRGFELTEIGQASTLFDGAPEPLTAVQWHGAEVKEIPMGASVLARSADCDVEAMSWGTRAYGTQFHIEMEADTVRRWASGAGAQAVLERELGEGGAARFMADCEAHAPASRRLAERLYMNWLQSAAHI